jgi:hypothetical protein
MIPVYFPYTYISRHIAEAIYACLGRFTVYQPLTDQLPPSMQKLLDEGIIDIRTPVEGGDRELVSAARNYLEWANTHAEGSGRHLASLKAIQASTPVTEGDLSSKIVADVRKQMNGHSDSQLPNAILAARIFLYFAQRFDHQSQELDHGLKEFSQKKQALIQNLKMEDDDLTLEFNSGPAHSPDENADYLVAGRLEAWTRILLNDTQPAGLYVTHSPAVVEQLFDTIPSVQKIFDFAAIPRLAPVTASLASWQEQLFSYLSDIAYNKEIFDPDKKIIDFDFPSAENTVSLKFYMVRDQNPRDFFCRATGIKIPDTDHRSSAASRQNTLFALVGL